MQELENSYQYQVDTRIFLDIQKALDINLGEDEASFQKDKRIIIEQCSVEKGTLSGCWCITTEHQPSLQH